MSTPSAGRSLSDILGAAQGTYDELRPGMSSSIALSDTEPVEDAETPDPEDTAGQTPNTAKPARNKKKLWWIIGACGAVVVVVGLILGLTLRTPAKATPTTRTQPFTVATTTMETSVSASGTIQPAQRADLNFTSAGTVTYLSVSVGDTVTSGQEMASIDTTDLQSAVNQAQAAVDAAQTDYNTAVSSGSATQQTAAKSTLTTKKNALDNAKTALANATLTAPFDGTVAIVNVSVGDKVTAGSGGGGGSNPANITNGSNAGNASNNAAITIITANTYQVTTSVGSADVGNVMAGQPCTITPDSTNTRLDGTVASVGVVASSSSASGATFPVVIDVTGTQDGLYAGVNASISIVTSSRTVLAVPTAAITRQGPNEYVDVQDGSGNITQTQVQTGATSGGMTEVTSGVKAGDVVVITITIQGGSNANPGGFPSMFGGGNGGRQRPSGYPSGGDFPGNGGGNFPGPDAQPGSGPSQ